MTDRRKKNPLGRMFRGICLVLGICCLSGCDAFPELDSGSAPADNPESLTILTWNIQALFDGVDEGNEYDEYLTAAGWSDEKYRARLTAIARGIDQIDGSPPDIIGFQEVENGEIVRMLAEEALPKHGYNWTFFARNPGASLGIGVLSRFPLAKTTAHSIFNNSEAAPRPVLELWMSPGGMDLVIFVCHWKSKLGGDEATEELRRASARVLIRRIGEIEGEKPGTPVIIMGDLNENHDEFYRKAGRVISALLPDDPKAAELADSAENDAETGGRGRDFLLISRQKPPVAEYFDSETEIFYSPWGNELQQGSYNYKNEWETIDHFLLTGGLFDQQGWDFHSGGVINQEPFISAYGIPNAYNARTGNGLSDHLPLVLKLIRH